PIAKHVVAERLAEEDRCGERLLAGRTARRPDPDRRRPRPVLEDARDHLGLDEPPRLRIAEELGDVDQDRVEELGELVAVVTEIRLVVLERLRADQVHSLLEAASEARPLVERVVEAAGVPNALEQLFERRMELGLSHDSDGRTSSTTAAAMSSSARTRSTTPLAIAADGMPKYSEVAWSCASTKPPAPLTAAAPSAPSDPAP